MAINYCITTVQTKPCFTSCAAGNHKHRRSKPTKKISWKHDSIYNVRQLRQRPLAAPCWNFAHYWPIHSILMIKKERKTYILWHDGKKYHPYNWSLLLHQKIHHKNLKEKKIHHSTLINLVLRTFFVIKIPGKISIRRGLTNLWICEFTNFFQIWNSFGRFVIIPLLRNSFLIEIPGNISIGLKTLCLESR